ncbi:FPR2 [Candida pseudojiufengensis]|uniref:FPR2 n=1 Tax=Candida pseudojiufengensis TaxID=497109 RepID=UPI002225A111|nr:FPR2 [Candida pseudojiufengensis]KAI5962424.1 FPR2 [Candida pseudojiufengensis]
MKFLSITIALTATIASVLASPPTPDQLKIDITKEVKCTRKTQPGDAVSVHYRGTFEDGTKFDSSYDRGTPLSFKVGSGQVIKCWDEGLLDMCIGEKRTLWCDSSICYGERGIGPIPGGSNLIFETELVSIAGVKSEEVEDLENDDEVSKDEL